MTPQQYGAGCGPAQGVGADVVEPKRKPAGRARVNARSLSPVLSDVIYARFRECASTEEIAEELRIPVRTVTDTILVALIKAGEPARGPFMVRRAA